MVVLDRRRLPDRVRSGREAAMTATERALLAVAVVLVDVLLFALPLTGIFAAYVLLARPPWFRRWFLEMYDAP